MRWESESEKGKREEGRGRRFKAPKETSMISLTVGVLGRSQSNSNRYLHILGNTPLVLTTSVNTSPITIDT